MAHPSNSGEQQAAEDEVRRWLSAQSGSKYTSERVPCGDEFVEVDAVGRSGDRIVELVEIYARQGKLKGGQLKKPTDDAARLMLAAKHIEGDPKLRLAWCSEEAVAQVNRGWRGSALKAMGVELVFVPLKQATVTRIRDAQIRQRR